MINLMLTCFALINMLINQLLEKYSTGSCACTKIWKSMMDWCRMTGNYWTSYLDQKLFGEMCLPLMLMWCERWMSYLIDLGVCWGNHTSNQITYYMCYWSREYDKWIRRYFMLLFHKVCKGWCFCCHVSHTYFLHFEMLKVLLITVCKVKSIYLKHQKNVSSMS